MSRMEETVEWRRWSGDGGVETVEWCLSTWIMFEYSSRMMKSTRRTMLPIASSIGCDVCGRGTVDCISWSIRGQAGVAWGGKWAVQDSRCSQWLSTRLPAEARVKLE